MSLDSHAPITNDIAPEGDEHEVRASPEALWLAKLCTDNYYEHPKLLSKTTYAVIAPFLYTHAIIVGRIGDSSGYNDRWCYSTTQKAKDALDAWDGTGEPQGWHRHPNTGRRRAPDGTETINF